MDREQITVTALQRQVAWHVKWNAPIHPDQIARDLGTSEASAHTTVGELVDLDLLERWEPDTCPQDLYCVTRRAMHAELSAPG